MNYPVNCKKCNQPLCGPVKYCPFCGVASISLADISAEKKPDIVKEIDDKRREKGEQLLQPTISGIMADGKYEPIEKATALEIGRKANLSDVEIVALLIKIFEAKEFYPQNQKKEELPKEKWLDVVWVTKRYEEEHHDEKTLQDPTAILEHDFVTATKRDKKLYPGNEKFLYDKGVDLGLERSKVTELIEKWTEEYSIKIPQEGGDKGEEEGEPKLEIIHKSAEFLNMKIGSVASGSFTINNVGSGKLSGSISTDKNWLKVSRSDIDTKKHRQDVEFTVNTTGLCFGLKDTGTIEIQSTGGINRISVNLSLEAPEKDIDRFRKALTIVSLILGGFLGFKIYDMSFIRGTDIATLTGIVAIVCAIIIVGRLRYKDSGGGAAFGWGCGTLIAGFIVLAILGYFPHAFSTIAWASTYGMLGYILASAIRKALWRGDKKVPIAVGIGVVALSTLVIIIGTKGSIPFQKSAPPIQYNLNIASNNANVRKSPSESANIIATLTKGLNIGVLDTQGNWCKVQYYNVSKKNTEVGWIHQSLLTPRGSSTQKSQSNNIAGNTDKSVTYNNSVSQGTTYNKGANNFPEGNNINSVIFRFYDSVQKKDVDSAMGMFAAEKLPQIKRNLIAAVAKDTEYYKIDRIAITENDDKAKADVILYHKKYRKHEEQWEITVELVKENGFWKIWSTPGRRIR